MTSNVVPLKKPSAPLKLRIELEGVRPLVWRVVQVPESIPLDRLHQVIQIAMGWEDSHLHEFIIGKARYRIPDPDFYEPGTMIAEKGVPLAKALGSGKRFQYSYDFGDGWEHTVTVEERGVAADLPAHPQCLAGENACPPEDVGGPPGYAEFLKVIANPRHKRRKAMIEWSGGGFDAGAFDLAGVNRKLKRLRV